MISGSFSEILLNLYFRAYLAAQALFVDRLSKLSNYSAGSGLNDLATVLGDFIQLEKNCAHSQATKARFVLLLHVFLLTGLENSAFQKIFQCIGWSYSTSQ